MHHGWTQSVRKMLEQGVDGMNEQAKKKIAVLERALLIASQILSDEGYHADGSLDPEKICEWFKRTAQKDLRAEEKERLAEAIKKHPRALY